MTTLILTESKNIWFTSDNHFGHNNVIKYCNRPFSSVEEMNEIMVQKWNERVRPGDIVYHLGDFSLGTQSVIKYVPRLMGDIHLIAGNHDHVHPIHYKKEAKGELKRKLYFEAGIKSIKLEDIIEIDGRKFHLHHMPYVGDHEAERYTNWRPENKGIFLLHGHVHEKWLKKDLMVNVGVDVWDFYPVHLDEIWGMSG